jgi:hypothetical protein
VEFQIGDAVRDGTRVGTVTDVGTVLIQMTTNEGGSRVVCPWELVRLRHSHESSASAVRRNAITK